MAPSQLHLHTNHMLAHFIIVRRDLPLGIIAAMVTHAAGESAVLYKSPMGVPFNGCTAVVLEVKNEKELDDVIMRLFDANISHIRVRESSPPYLGATMAIGVVPLERELMGDTLAHLQVLKTCNELQQLSYGDPVWPEA